MNEKNAYVTRIEKSIDEQPFLKMLGLKIDSAEKGKVVMSIENKKDFSQYLGYMHGGMVATLLDSAGAYAVHTLLNENETVVTSELKINYIRPCISKKVIVYAEVLNKGKTISVVEAYIKNEENKLVSKMSASMFIVQAKN